MIVKLNILASDIRANNYTDSFDCPITRALKRADIEGQDHADYISIYGRGRVTNESREDYVELRKKVIGMYRTSIDCQRDEDNQEFPKIPIEDFKHELELDI